MKDPARSRSKDTRLAAEADRCTLLASSRGRRTHPIKLKSKNRLDLCEGKASAKARFKPPIEALRPSIRLNRSCCHGSRQIRLVRVDDDRHQGCGRLLLQRGGVER